MIPVSNAFHRAILSGAKQRNLLHFTKQGLWMTHEDIVLGSISYSMMMNPDEDMQLGSTPSAEYDFAVFNDDGLLNDFTFGEFDAYRGVMIGRERSAGIRFNGHVMTASATSPYLRSDGSAFSIQPLHPVDTMLAVDNKLYCVSSNKDCTVITVSGRQDWDSLEETTWGSISGNWNQFEGTYSSETITLSDWQWKFFSRRIMTKTNASKQENMVYLNANGETEIYEMCQLGRFYAERPARVRNTIVSVMSYDAMQAKMEVYGDEVNVVWPATLSDMLRAVCTAAGVVCKADNLLNDTKEFDNTTADIFQSITLREAVGYIAEAAGGYAFIDYDGKLDVRWFNRTSLVVDGHQFKTFVPYEYVVKGINKLQIRNSSSDVGVIYGLGTNTYVIQNNPFMAFQTDAEGQLMAAPLYNRLQTFLEYVPASLNWFADWSYQCLDIITVVYDNRQFLFPIFNRRLSGTGLASADDECTGNEMREILSEVNREEYEVGRRMTEIVKSIEGVTIRVTESISQMEARVEITEQGLESKVSKDNVISSINQSAEAIRINANKIEISGASIVLEGAVTANGNFHIDEYGTMSANEAVITNAYVTGELVAGNWLFNSAGAAYSSGYGAAIITDRGDGYITFRTSGYHAEYGADATHNTIVSGQAVYLAGTANSQMVIVGQFVSPATGQLYNDTSIVNSAANSYTPKGNIGVADKRWDIVYTRTVNQSSSREIKKDITPLEDVGTIIDELVPVRFKYKSNDEKSLGLILEDTVELVPEACFIPDDGNTANGGIDYSKLVPILIKEVQELRKRVHELEVAK